jgi:anti-sigma factor (TIGR02949 family)
MNCKDARSEMHGYLDGELDLVRSQQLESHLLACPVCRQAYEGQQALSAAIKAQASYFRTPGSLQARIRSSLHVERESKAWTVQWGWLGLGASLAFAVMLAWNLVFLSEPGLDQEEQLAQEVVSNHVRSLMEGHLTDVPSSDQHTAQGFPLVGGRLDYLDEHPVAALIYGHRRHLINVFVWPERKAADTIPHVLSHQGFNIVYFNRAGMAYWTISDLNSDELRQFVELLQG